MHTIPSLFEAAVERAPDKTWLFHGDASYSYSEAAARIGSVAAGLAALGVRHGTRVLATTRNTDDYLFVWFACMRLAAELVPVNPASSPTELAGLIGQVEPAVVVTDRDLEKTVLESVADVASGARAVLVEDLSMLEGDAPPIAAAPEDVSVMIPTSGTTGRSKLVMQTHRAYAMAGEGFPYWMELTDEDRLMTSLPLFHVNAPAYSILGSVAAGASLVLLERFSGSGFIDAARRYGATEFNAVGAMIEILMRQPERDDDADNPLRLCYTGPSPAKERHLEIERRFGLRIVCGYALSESPYGLIWRRGTRPFGTLGSTRQHPEMGEINFARVRDGESEVVVGEVGEIELKNPAVMLGYFNMPEETAAVMENGWLKTGDLVEVNGDGIFTFVGRKKELIRRRGENLAPAEVEMALEAHPDVAEAAVVGVPSELSEEEVKAFLLPAAGATISIPDVRDFVSERLARFKVPRYFEVVDELPHTPTGRIAKHELPRERNDEEIDLDPQSSAQGER